MKLTIATSVLASSISVAAESLPDPVGRSLRDAVEDTARATHRSLSLAHDQQNDITAMLKERRASKKQNSNVIRNLQNKLKRSRLRNQAQDDSAASDTDLDLGFFDRNLQANITEPESNVTEPEELSVIEELLNLCNTRDEKTGFSCSCSNIDVDAYTANVFCTYDQNCLPPSENACGGSATFCFVETYELEVLAPGTGSSKVCYEVNSPTTFTYCYGLNYNGVQASPSACYLEVDGTQCSSCDFYYESPARESSCFAFDCNNVDDVIGVGSVCGNETVVSAKIEDYLIYGPLPCEGGCNICPQGGEMQNLDNNVTLITGEQYQCFQLNLAALFGYLQDVPGDLCNTLPAIVNQPCECPGFDDVSTPLVDPTSDEAPTGGVPGQPTGDVDGFFPGEGEAGNGGSGSAAAFSGFTGFAVTTAVTCLFSWMMA